MTRDIYASRHKVIRELKQARMKEPFVKEVLRMSRQVNQRFYRLEKANKGLADTSYRFAQKETGKDKPRYSVNKQKLEEMTIEELYKLSLQLNQKIISKTSTIKGLEEVEQTRVKMSLGSLNEDVGQKEITESEEEQWKRFLERGGGEIMNNKFLDSYQIREDWYNYTYMGGVSIKTFLKEYTNFFDTDIVDYGKIRRRLINLSKKSKKGKNQGR